MAVPSVTVKLTDCLDSLVAVIFGGALGPFYAAKTFAVSIGQPSCEFGKKQRQQSVKLSIPNVNRVTPVDALFYFTRPMLCTTLAGQRRVQTGMLFLRSGRSCGLNSYCLTTA